MVPINPGRGPMSSPLNQKCVRCGVEDYEMPLVTTQLGNVTICQTCLDKADKPKPETNVSAVA